MSDIIQHITDIYNKCTNNMIFKVFLVLFNVFVFTSIIGYIEFVVIYKVAIFGFAYVVITKFILLPILAIIWLRLNPSLPKLIMKDYSKPHIYKISTNCLIFVVLLYEVVKYYSQYNPSRNILAIIFPLHFIPGISGQIGIFENYNLVMAIFEVLTIAVLLLIIYIKNFDNTKKCPICGVKVSIRQKFCKKCGSKLE